MPQPPSMTKPPLSLVALCAATTVVAALAGAATATVESRERAKGAAPSSPACREGRLSTSYLRRVNRVLRARHDAWGRTLLASPRGPTYERIERYLPPLFFASGRNGRPLTDSGVHYTHFSQPETLRGATSFALHVADGSQVITRRSHGRRLTVGVGLRGQERYGSCLRRLELPELVDGYLPILVTRYTDSHGVRYEQESFVARIPETRSLVSFVRVVADAGDARTKLVRLRFTPSVDGLESDGSRLRRAGRTYVVFGEGGSYSSPSVKFAVRRGEVRTAYVGWLHQPSRHAAARPRRAALPRGARERAGILGSQARARRPRRRPRGARERCGSEPPDPEPRNDVALQRGQPLRAALHPRGRRRRARARRVRPSRREPHDPAHGSAEAARATAATGGTTDELEDRRATRRLRALRAARGRPVGDRAGDSGTAPIREGHRRPAARKPQRAPPARALLVRRRRACLRPAHAGRRLAGAACDVAGLGGRGLHAARRRVATAGAQARDAGSAVRSVAHSDGCRAARSSSRHSCSTTWRHTAP